MIYQIIYRIRPRTDRWGRPYGSGNGGGWHWYDILIGIALFVLYMLGKEYLPAYLHLR